MPGSSGGARCHVQVFPCVVNLPHVTSTRPYFALPRKEGLGTRLRACSNAPKYCYVESIIIARNSKCFLKHF